MKRGILALVAVSAATLTSTSAFAQTASASASAGAQAATPTPEEGERDHARFRWGISGFGGPMLIGGTTSGAGGLDVRLGATINNLFGIYAQPMFLVGGQAGAAGGGGAGFAGVGVLAELTPIDMFYVAVGPEFVNGFAFSSGPTGTAAGGIGGTFSLAARAGVALGSSKPARRKAFTIGLDFRSMFTAGSTVVVPAIALGYDAY